jgi:lactate permease
VSFKPLSSPGLALAATALILARGRVAGSEWRTTAARAWKPVLALGGFTVMAQLMVAGDMVGTIGVTLSSIGLIPASAFAPFVGMLSGYLTGSNVGGNALMMSVQSTVGAKFGQALTFAAIQNSSAGHAVFASMPIVLLVLAIAGGAQNGEESDLVRYGLWMADVVYVVTVIASVTLVVLA